LLFPPQREREKKRAKRINIADEKSRSNEIDLS
jgi:hypothetical protein